jgi:hypothetical protein
MKKKANSPVVQVVQLESPLERLSDCRTVPYLRFFLVRNEEAVGSNPISSTIFSKRLTSERQMLRQLCARSGGLKAICSRDRLRRIDFIHGGHLSLSLGLFVFSLVTRLRRWPPSHDDVKEAEEICREPGFGGLIERMPAGLLQMVGETGWQLSHGNCSLLYVARALLQRTAREAVLQRTGTSTCPLRIAECRYSSVQADFVCVGIGI